MTFKIEMVFGKGDPTARLIGELRTEHLNEVKAELERSGPKLVLDLEDVCFLSVDAVRFLNSCVDNGAVLLNCPPYILEWMFRERTEEQKGSKRNPNS